MLQCINLGLLEVQRLLGGEAAVPLPDAEQRVRGDGVGPLRLPTLVLVHCLHTTNLSTHLCYSGSIVKEELILTGFLNFNIKRLVPTSPSGTLNV